MAGPKEEGRGEKGLQQDPLVTALVPEGKEEPPNATVLHGYLGQSATKKCWRLYLDASLGSYTEVPEADILHHQHVADEGGTLIWVPSSLELKVTKVSSATVQAEFLSGVIAAGRMKPVAGSNVGFRGGAVASVGCPSILNNCTSQILACPSDGCPTWSNCPPPPTETGWCKPSEFAPLCTIFRF